MASTRAAPPTASTFGRPGAGPGTRAEDTADVVGRRIGAAVIDGVLLAALFIVIGIASGGGHAGHGRAAVNLGSGPSLVFLLASLGYFFVCEAIWGQTLGKRLLGVRVVRLDGSRAGAAAVFLRTFLRLVDALPVLYLVGLISVLATGDKRRQRLGDLAAGTTVRAS